MQEMLKIQSGKVVISIAPMSVLWHWKVSEQFHVLVTVKYVQQAGSAKCGRALKMRVQRLKLTNIRFFYKQKWRLGCQLLNKPILDPVPDSSCLM